MNQLTTMEAAPNTKVPVRNDTTFPVHATTIMKTSHNNYKIHSRNVIWNRSMQQQTPNRSISEVGKHSAKMLILQASGEQRLITFNLPEKSGKIQDLLKQVGISFDDQTTIECAESPGTVIEFVVTVGFRMQESPRDIISRAEQILQSRHQQAAATTAAVQQKVSKKAATPTPVAVMQVAQEVSTTTLPVHASSVMKITHNNYKIRSRNVILNRSFQPLTPNRAISEVDKNSAKMLIILASGEQRLITFKLPKESSTVQELLEQAGIPFDDQTTIECTESPGRFIDFVVTVGFHLQEPPSDIISRVEATLKKEKLLQQQQQYKFLGKLASKPAIALQPRKRISGFLDVCKSCGLSGADRAKFERCKRIFTGEPVFTLSSEEEEDENIKQENCFLNLGHSTSVESPLECEPNAPEKADGHIHTGVLRMRKLSLD